MEDQRGRITQMLIAWRGGDAVAGDQLAAAVYDELRRVARGYMSREAAGHTLQPTALVHEAYVRLIDQRHVVWRNRAHFYGIAAQAMRRLLVDRARARHAEKRGAGVPTTPLDDVAAIDAEPGEMSDELLLALNRALERLAVHDAIQSRIVELRYFGGLTIDEAAHVLGTSTGTIKREWRMARAWLKRELGATTMR